MGEAGSAANQGRRARVIPASRAASGSVTGSARMPPSKADASGAPVIQISAAGASQDSSSQRKTKPSSMRAL